jgi:hypothetical protein
MNGELIDSAWRVLPNEFKEEVKKRYKGCLFTANRYAKVEADLLEEFFGLHNLTSDAEGEEMLTISRKEVQEQYRMYRNMGMIKRLDTLINLFGSKCLPDEAASESASKVANEEPRPAEPKFKVGDKVRYQDFIGTVYQIEESDYIIRNLARGDLIGWIKESDLAPYTEPKEDHIVQDHEIVDRIIKDGFLGELRLNIAAQMMQGLICAPLIPGCNPNPPAEQLAQTAFRLADAFIAEAEKGGKA